MTNVKKIILCMLVVLLLPHMTSLYAGDYIGVGMHGGLQYDVGNLGGLTGVEFEGQHNAIAVLTLKLDRNHVFFRTGADRSIMFAKGKVLNNSYGRLTTLKIQYTSIPMYAGLNFMIRERGKFYIGFGIAYILGSGEVKTTNEKVKINENVFGLGFLTGVQLRIGSYARIFTEWEYISARTKPVINTSTTNTWKDFSIDYTGHRIYMGLSYYIL